ncbi:MAG: cupin domain-containing protein [Xenococcaceae cyanobacterium MO_188.B32]|nr:cupin domain-containing protein [Xenococcaceae cyanobacterium MO_188.B32]
MNKHDLIEQLSLVEHIEGGYFSETHRSQHIISSDREGNERNIFTSIYYLLTIDFLYALVFGSILLFD